MLTSISTTRSEEDREYFRDREFSDQKLIRHWQAGSTSYKPSAPDCGTTTFQSCLNLARNSFESCYNFFHELGSTSCIGDRFTGPKTVQIIASSRSRLRRWKYPDPGTTYGWLDDCDWKVQAGRHAYQRAHCSTEKNTNPTNIYGISKLMQLSCWTVAWIWLLTCRSI